MADIHRDDVQGTTFGSRLRDWRHRQRMTQEQLAEALGYDVSYIRKIEGGARAQSRAFQSRLAMVAGPSWDAETPTSMGDLARPALPQAPDVLIGRDDTIAAVADLLAGPARVVTLVGPPGIGKTRLAMAVAARLDPVFPDGAWWVPLLEVNRAADVGAQALRALGVADQASGDPVEAVVQALRDQKALLVLDNFEHVMAARSVVSRIVAGAGRVKVLVTSREALELVSEHVVTISPLRFLDPATKPTLDAVRSCPAVELFLARATMARRSFELTEDNCAAVLAACARLDGLPLAIVLTAGAVRTDDPILMAQRLESEGIRLAGEGPLDLPPHHRSLEVAIARSWDLLAAEEREFFTGLAVFSGGFTVESAASVTATATSAARRLLASLSRKSLVDARTEAPSGPRFTLLEMIRSFVANRLGDSGRAEELRRRHSEYFVGFASTCAAGLIGGEQVRSAQAFGDEFENLQLAFDASLLDAPSHSLSLATSCWRFFLIRDIPTGQLWLDTALNRAQEPTAERAEALAACGALAWVTGHTEVAKQCLEEAAAMAEQLHLAAVTALVEVNRGALDEALSRLDQAKRHFARALAISQSLEDRRGQAVAMNGLGMIWRRRGDIDKAWPFWQEAASLFRQVRDGANEGIAMGNLAWAAEVEGRLAEAEKISLDCRAIQITLGDVRGLAATTAALGRIAYRRQRFDEARTLNLEALDGFRRLGDMPWLASTILALGAIIERMGAPEPALTLLAAAQLLWEQMGSHPREEEQLLMDEVVARCQAQVDQRPYDRAWVAGRFISIADVAKVVADATNTGAGDP